jgi:hypothetical protein
MRLIAMIAFAMSLAACQPAAAPLPKDPPAPQAAEDKALFERQVQGANALNAELRGRVGLAAEPAGDTVVRIVQGSFMPPVQESLVAVRSSAGWRLEWVDSKFGTAADKAKPARLRVITVPPADGRRLDALLADPAFFRQSVYEPRTTCFEPRSMMIEVRTPAARWAGFYICDIEPLATKVADVLFSLRPAD